MVVEVSDDDFDLEAELEAALDESGDEEHNAKVEDPVKEQDQVARWRLPPAADRNQRIRLQEGCSSEAAGDLGRIPPELLFNVFKFLSPEDLAGCASACRLLRSIASDEGLWRRLYCLRWGASKADKKAQRQVQGWRKSYFERDKKEMQEFVRTSPPEFREIYAQMQATKRGRAPAAEQARADDSVVLDPSLGEQISAWRQKHGLSDAAANSPDHFCSGRSCSYHQIGDVFLCEKTGRAHLCDETCKEIVTDPDNDLLVCAVSGRCFDRWLNPGEEETAGPQGGEATGGAEEQEFLMGSGRLGRAYLLGYNCEDERELNAAIRDIIYSS